MAPTRKHPRIKRLLRSFLKPFLGQRALRFINKARVNIADKRGHPSHSQEGEDKVLKSLLYNLNGGNDIVDGFYVDIGAHHPYRFSNTCLFYRRGWRGINVDATPGSMSLFRKERKRDINLETGVGGKTDSLKFFIFNEPALNTFDETLAEKRCNGNWYITSTADIPVIPLSEILEKHLPTNQKINFFSIDVEGFDLDVLQSNDWEKFRPQVVLAETLRSSVEDLLSNPLVQFLHSKGYVVYSKTVNTTFFVDRKALAKRKLIGLSNSSTLETPED